ncbi:MAG TPA: hypothetical protein VKS98_13460 [Chthoniobacterales bacterium]|nr:hypothetical protein [Chthoniobacterales bacterium]
MSSAANRSILRWIHLVFVIPIVGYIYQPPAEVQQYAGGVRLIFFPVIMLSGYWMYAGVVFAVIGVALWLGLFQLYGFGAALIGQVVLFIARKIWLMVRARGVKQVAS